MDIRLIMSFLYPILAATAFVVAGLALLFWAMRRRTTVVLSQALCFYAEFATLALLTLTTGAAPVLDIEQFRSWVVITRILLLVALWFHAYQLWQRISAERGKK